MDSHPPEHHPHRWLLLSVPLLVFLYFAREYPQWRAERLLLQNQSRDKNPDTTQPNNTAATTAESSTTDTSQSLAPWPDKFSARWIPYLPFAVVYLALKALWTGLRFLVLHSLLAAEYLGIFLMGAIEELTTWTFLHGPDFVRNKILAPLHAVAVAVSKSPAVVAIAASIENTLIPAVVRAANSCYSTLSIATVRLITWIRAVAEPARSALEWFAVECIYNPLNALWVRLAVLGNTFLQTAKIYLHELAKDARDLGWVVVKVATWIWARTLQPLGKNLYALGEWAMGALTRFVPWLAQKVYTGVLRPTGMAVLDGFRILRSHPTFLAGIHALSSKVKEKCTLVLQRLESVNWLVLLETVLTKTFTTLYHYTTIGLQLVGQGIKVFAMDIVPNAYNDLMMALEVARPVVAWVIDKFVKITYPLWQAVSWISWTVYTNSRPTLAWLNQRVVLPSVKLWEARILPGLSYAAMMVLMQTKAATDMILKVAPGIATAIAPVWGAVLKLVEMLQGMLGQMLSQIVYLSGGLGERIQERVKSMAPQFEVFKERTGQAMDEVVLTTSNLMMDWVKKEKRD
ncbi:hypothetical protein BC939DRAFT_442450 [Gamsiella multidivaricata]|uniref:uncharacterized protein n=1 Tax=Gamsiella multidivaricata TaxID=101098 RepID=UPI0022202028|nr:uncharacterized protein BC939DRAFT_442450 [Gamsiella multidivaricata]KAG0366979.1 hypothetical protein BGZ54_004600 [Gamsiella multidivaricata]KAI7828991.1 hypothetical protein BC939DRAFT_442450 [Gamsiella multidivaricata]